MSNMAQGEWGKDFRKPICLNVNGILVIWNFHTKKVRLKKRIPKS